MSRWGSFVHHHRWWTLSMAGVVLALSVLLLLRGGELRNPRSLNLEAGHASNLVNTQLPRTAGSSFDLLFTSDHLRVDDPRFRAAMDTAIGPLLRDRRVKEVITPFSERTPDAARLASRDRAAAIARVELREEARQSRGYYPELRAKVRSGQLHVLAFNGVADGHAFDQYLASDLQRAELISIPATIILLLVVFGALLAAGLPLVIGIVSIIGGIGGIYLVAGFTDVSSYAQNVVTLIGLGVSVDYSLFIVNRFREELGKGASREAALAAAMATAGRAILFSGVTVAIGLSGMLFYTGSFLPSMGLAGGIVVVIAVFYSLTLLPALLAILGPRVNRFTISIAPSGDRRVWHSLALAVMRRPVVVLLPTVAIIVFAGLPFRHLRLANSDIETLPAASEVVRGHELAARRFPDIDRTTIVAVAQFPGPPLTAERVGAVYDLSRRLAAIPGVARVASMVNLDPGIDRAGYQRLYAAPAASLPAPIGDVLHHSVGRDIVVLSVLTDRAPESDGAREILRTMRTLRPVGDGHLQVTGQTAFDLDIVNFILDRTPGAVAFIVAVTGVVLFLLLGSVLLPLKAVVMNFLSISASFGALVWIFQDGHLSGLFGFRPEPVDPSIPVLLFCIVFGLSMDYEVLLMSRMKEEWERTHDNRHAVAEGLELSGRLVTGAAAIMFVVFLGFGLAQVLLIKELGVGMAIAVAIDATLVRALIVPATMRLLGGANWWAPGPVARLYQRLGLGESGAKVRPNPDTAA
ncbi:MAG: MMPL family transporter [Candidatus Dormibacteraeota bacterium]|nr:MMPL family transporter [Candidatus Dormibacteraeota bacterium]